MLYTYIFIYSHEGIASWWRGCDCISSDSFTFVEHVLVAGSMRVNSVAILAARVMQLPMPHHDGQAPTSGGDCFIMVACLPNLTYVGGIRLLCINNGVWAVQLHILSCGPLPPMGARSFGKNRSFDSYKFVICHVVFVRYKLPSNDGRKKFRQKSVF